MKKSRCQPSVKMAAEWVWPGTAELSAAPGVGAVPRVTQNGLMSSSMARTAPAATMAWARSVGNADIDPA